MLSKLLRIFTRKDSSFGNSACINFPSLSISIPVSFSHSPCVSENASIHNSKMFSAHFEQINIMHILFTYMEIYTHIFWYECHQNTVGIGKNVNTQNYHVILLMLHWILAGKANAKASGRTLEKERDERKHGWVSELHGFIFALVVIQQKCFSTMIKKDCYEMMSYEKCIIHQAILYTYTYVSV